MLWEEIGDRIKALRIDSNLTQAQFGKLIGKSTQYVGRIERGQKASVELIAAICKETGVTTDYVLFGITDPLAKLRMLDNFSTEQIELCLDIIQKVTELIRTPKGNKLLLNELMRRQSMSA